MATHQTGKGRIPKRTFLLFQDEDNKNIVKIFSEYLGEIIK